MLDRIEMDGPGTYQRTDTTDDAFLVIDPETEESIKVWRQEGVVRDTRTPEQYPTPEDIVADLTEPGTWRESLWHWPSWMEYDAVNEELLALVPGEDAGGVVRIGWVRGSWDEETGRVAWTDDPHPRNPMFTLDELRAVTGGTSQLFATVGGVDGVFEVAEGDWALTFEATIGNPDGMAGCALTGSPDRYSFDPAEHFSPDLNPLAPPLAGDDRVVPDGSGIGLYGNRDVDPRWVRNPWARDRGERFWAYARAKTINHEGDEFEFQPARPLSCLVTGDFRNVRTLPWRNQLIVPCFAFFHWVQPEWFGPSTVGLVVDDGGASQSNVNLWVAEDGVHLARTLGQPLIPKNTPPFNSVYLQPQANPVRLGERRLYWYRSG
ncbi:MAG: hypothetical protein U9R79_07970, partial [Armatimonadota bacterium]|nr:hypothetical protein [Armatimonadota bacterium]